MACVSDAIAMVPLRPSRSGGEAGRASNATGVLSKAKPPANWPAVDLVTKLHQSDFSFLSDLSVVVVSLTGLVGLASSFVSSLCEELGALLADDGRWSVE